MPWFLRFPNRRPYFRVGDLADWPPHIAEGNLKLMADLADVLAEGLHPCDPKDCPAMLRLESIENVKPFFTSINGWRFVEQVVKDLIEGLDPGRHQFLPINVTSLCGKARVEGNWFIMNVHVRARSILPEQSDVKVILDTPNRTKMMVKPFEKRLTMDAARLDPTLHIWREDMFGRELFISDTLREELKGIGVTPPLHQIELAGG